MRKIISIALCLLMLLSIVACKDNTTENTDTDKDTNLPAVTNTENNSPDTSSGKEPDKQVNTENWTKLY